MENRTDTEEKVQKKRGRKPKDPSTKIYFGDREERAVADYIRSDDPTERNRIYTAILEPAFRKLTESIIRTYSLYVPEEDFNDTLHDALSDIASKINKFDVESGKKAYSYYGTCIKHYVLRRRKEYQEALENQPSYDSLSETMEDDIDTHPMFDKPSTVHGSSERDKRIAQDEIAELYKKIKYMVDNPERIGLKNNERKLGVALLSLFDNWDEVIKNGASNKLNKSAVLYYLKEATGFDSKTVRTCIKKYKKEFLLVRDQIINEY